MKRDKLGLERIIFFSDAVFAIAITLLALDLKLPSSSATASLSYSLLSLWPEYQSYTTSFAIIGLYWIGHHHYFRFIRRYDYVLIGLNIILLACIATLPFATSVLDDYPSHRGAVALYAICMAVTGYMKAMLWAYATYKGRLVYRCLSWRRQRLLFQRALIPPTVFALSVGLVVLSPTMAKLSWLTISLICWPYPLHKPLSNSSTKYSSTKYSSTK